MLKKSPNGRLHLALLVAVVASTVIAIAIPISRTRASTDGGALPARSPASGKDLSSVLRVQAETLAGILASRDLSPGAGEAAYAPAADALLGSPLIPRPLMAAALRAAAGSVFDPAEPLAGADLRDQPIQFTLHEDGFASAQMSSRLTVGQTLASLGIDFTSHDDLSPGPDTLLTPGAHVYLDHAASVRLTVGGQPQVVYTHASTVQGLLQDAGVNLEAQDQVLPGLGEPVRDGMPVYVTTIRDANEDVDDPIDYSTVYQYDPSATEGQQTVLQAGTEGHLRREYKVRRVNGAEVTRELVAETVLPPQDEIVSVGTYVAPTPTPEPAWTPAGVPASPAELTCSRTMRVYATWYTAASAGGYGITATGTSVQKGIVAVDPSVIPLGTQIYVPGYGYGLAADTGGGIVGNMIDLGYGANDVYDWRSGWVDICILG